VYNIRYKFVIFCCAVKIPVFMVSVVIVNFNNSFFDLTFQLFQLTEENKIQEKNKFVKSAFGPGELDL